MEETINIELFGRSYRFEADTDVAKAKKVADILAAEVDAIKSNIPGNMSQMTQFTIMVSAALNIANRNLELNESLSQMKGEMLERTLKLTRRIDSGFPVIDYEKCR